MFFLIRSFLTKICGLRRSRTIAIADATLAMVSLRVDLRVPFRTGLERITPVRSKTVVLVDIKAGATLIRRFKREPYALMYLVHDRDACTEAAFPMVTFDVYCLLKSHDL